MTNHPIDDEILKIIEDTKGDPDAMIAGLVHLAKQDVRDRLGDLRDLTREIDEQSQIDYAAVKRLAERLASAAGVVVAHDTEPGPDLVVVELAIVETPEPQSLKAERPGGPEATAKQAATMRAHAADTACPACKRKLAVMDYADDKPGPRCRFCGWRPEHEHRNPYVGIGADGARRSAQIDRDEIATLAPDDPRRPALEESAARWDRQADELAAKEAPDAS